MAGKVESTMKTKCSCFEFIGSTNPEPNCPICKGTGIEEKSNAVIADIWEQLQKMGDATCSGVTVDYDFTDEDE